MKNAILQENNKKPKGKGKIFWLRNNNWEESAINRQIWVEKPHRGPRKLVNAWNFARFFYTRHKKKLQPEKSQNQYVIGIMIWELLKR